MDKTGDSSICKMDQTLFSLNFPRKFSSLLARIRSLYGEGITLQEFLNISENEFAAKRGVGNCYVKRLVLLQKTILRSKPDSSIPRSTTREDLEIWSIPISGVPDRYSALFTKLNKEYDIQTYADILTINVTEFGRKVGVGFQKSRQLKQWQSEILATKPINIDVDELLHYRFNYSMLNSSARSIITKYIRSGMNADEVSPTFIIRQPAIDICDIQSFGRKSYKALISLQRNIRHFLTNDTGPKDFLILINYGHDFTLADTAKCLLEDICKFLKQLNKQEKIIFTKRYGYGEEVLTLEELGNQFELTRERIRQKEKNIIFELLHSIRIQPSILHSKLIDIPVAQVLSEMNCLRREFITDDAYLRLLARLTDVEPNYFRQKAAPQIPQSILDEYFCSAKPPVRKSAFLDFLQEELNLETDLAKQAFHKLKENGQLSFVDHEIHPHDAKKEVALAHVLAGHPEGMSIQDLAREVNKLHLCRTPLSEDRPHSTLHKSTYIFQSDHRTYSHIHYLGLSRVDIKYWLNDIKRALEKSEYKAMHLRTEYYSRLTNPNATYYQVRFAARNFGTQNGIYFNGKSHADTVSLDPEISQVSQLEGLARLLSKTPMTFEEIVFHLNSQSQWLARIYINSLLCEGQIVYTENNHTYASPALAFADLDVERVITLVNSILKSDNRVHHLSVLSSHINRAADVDLTPRQCKSLIKAYAKREQWHLRGYLVSTQPFNYSGLADVARSAPVLYGEDLIAWIQQKVCASRAVIKNAIQNSGRDKATPDEQIFSEGLASDIMQELFDL